MPMKAICQRCGDRTHYWTVHQALFHVREMQNWKVQLCEPCAVYVEAALRLALLKTLPETETP